MKYAIIQSGGKQYRVSEGDVITVDNLSSENGKDIIFNDVLLFTTDGDVHVGTPTVNGVTVTAKVLDHVKGEKIRVSKFKAKARYRRVTGYRHLSTKLQIATIGKKQEGKSSSANLKAEKEETREVVVKKKTTRARRTTKTAAKQ